MGKFTEEAFKKAIEESQEAKDAEEAWGEYCVPTFLTAVDTVGKERVDALVRALSLSETEDAFFALMQAYFFSGFSCGRNR